MNHTTITIRTGRYITGYIYRGVSIQRHRGQKVTFSFSIAWGEEKRIIIQRTLDEIRATIDNYMEAPFHIYEPVRGVVTLKVVAPC